MRRPLIAVLFALSMVSVEDARAFPCASGASPFQDVPDNIFYCTNTLWLRNANVTLGCNAGFTFCPDEFVPRSQMALFMNRLARALTPEVVLDSGGPPSGDLDTDAYTCRSPNVLTIPPGNLRLFTTIVAQLSILTTGDADIGLGIQRSVDGGAFSPISSTTMAVHVPGNKWTMASIDATPNLTLGIGGLPLPPGSTYEFRVSMRRLPGSTTTGEVSGTRCQLRHQTVISDAQN